MRERYAQPETAVKPGLDKPLGDAVRTSAMIEQAEPPELPELLQPREVVELLRISSSTLKRWNQEGRISALRTLGGPVRSGHARYTRAEVERVWRLMHAPGQ